MNTKKKIVDPAVRAAQLKAELAAIESAQRKERHSKLIDELAAIRTELKAKRKAYSVLEKQVLEGQAAVDSIYSSQMAVIDARGRLASVRPQIADYLPNDETVVAWTTNINALDARLAKLREARSKLPNVQLLRIEAVQTHDAILNLEWRENNTLSELENRLATRPEGGSVGGIV